VFSHQGPARSARQNRFLAGYLALIAGYVNSAGFVLVGSFTSHVTGSVGRVAEDLVRSDYHAGVRALLLVVAFFSGAFIASSLLQTSFFQTRPRAYAMALFVEASLLAFFALIDETVLSLDSPRLMDAKASVLCLAMGMQNSLVTLISEARVRTTHLTGVATDLAIELARWFRWYRSRLSHRTRLPLVAGTKKPAVRPTAVTSWLLLTIILFFIVGAVAGAQLAMKYRAQSMVFPAVAVWLACAYALRSDRYVPRDELGVKDPVP
jgi:uncharacterized membrane protein YoaK (UPF0700 family)